MNVRSDINCEWSLKKEEQSNRLSQLTYEDLPKQTLNIVLEGWTLKNMYMPGFPSTADESQ